MSRSLVMLMMMMSTTSTLLLLTEHVVEHAFELGGHRLRQEEQRQENDA